ncbi:MAG: EAL domain-containing protein [Lachnospiraceae bacterium]|nr:EAL domain-containing protein [Lachnospiraceae bacterium]
MSIKKSMHLSFAVTAAIVVIILLLINSYIFKVTTSHSVEIISDLVESQCNYALSKQNRTGTLSDAAVEQTLSGLISKTPMEYRLLMNTPDSGTVNEHTSWRYYYIWLAGGEKFIHAEISIINYDKYIILEIPISYLIRSSRAEHFTVIALCIVIGVLFFICTEIVIKNISRPIHALSAAMKEASNGNLEVQCNIDSKNELGTLAKNFNKMMHIISSNYEDLSNMHEELAANEEELRKNYDHIEFLAYHDVLTRLPNKISFYDRLYNTLNSRHSDEHKHAIYFVDLDNFKTINDTLGHDYGDELLAQTAAKLSALMRPQDLLARAGGDEFLIFRADIDSNEEAISFGETMLDNFKEPFNLNGEYAHVSMSIGISIYPSNGHNHNTLIKNADIAMYHSKDTGKNKVTIFTSEMQQQLQRESSILDALRSAIKNNEIYLVYQPQFNANDNTITGFEALMRINSAKLGPLSPTEFIPVAESNGLIAEIGLWSLRCACLMNKNLLDRGYKPRKVAVNLSSIQLRNLDFVSELGTILKETELPPHLLELELTESMLVSSIEEAKMMLSDLRKLGVCVSLDDFGTGYSSLNYLTKLPINTLKIDKSFIDHIFEDEKDTQLAESIISLAHALDITVVAEGVENGSQLSLLRSMHCDLIQGFLLSKPLLAEQLVMLLD